MKKSFQLFAVTCVGTLFFAFGYQVTSAQVVVEGSSATPPPQTASRIIVGTQGEGGDGPVQIQAFQLSGDWSSVNGGVVRLASPAFPSAGGRGGMMNLLNNESIRKEIELVDDQYKQIQEFNQRIQKQIMEEVNAFTKPSADSKKSNSTTRLRGRNLAELIKKQKEEAQTQLKELLLPHQVKRLEQLSVQMAMKNSNTAFALTTGKIREALELDDDDVKELREKSRELEEKLARDIAELRTKAKEELIKTLSPAQRKKLEEIQGDKFEDEQPNWRSRLKRLKTLQTPNIRKSGR